MASIIENNELKNLGQQGSNSNLTTASMNTTQTLKKGHSVITRTQEKKRKQQKEQRKEGQLKLP